MVDESAATEPGEVVEKDAVMPIAQAAPDVIHASGPTAAEAATETAEQREARKARERNYSFLHKRPDSLDEVEVNGQKFTIPAGSVGSCYWGILKVAYAQHDQRIYTEDLLNAVSEVMSDRDPDAWEAYCNKGETTVHKKTVGASAAQKARPWQERVINNAKTLTRKGGSSPYGKRLHERGHALCFERDEKDRGYFILHTGEKAKEALAPKVKVVKAKPQETPT